ncbi:hypothetical protein V8D89_003762 [Ganoderma adspersum]
MSLIDSTIQQSSQPSPSTRSLRPPSSLLRRPQTRLISDFLVSSVNAFFPPPVTTVGQTRLTALREIDGALKIVEWHEITTSEPRLSRENTWSVELDGLKFDLAVCSASFHHFPSLEDMSRLLASFLKPGGALVVADIKAAPDGRLLFPETHHHLVPHRDRIIEAHLRGAFESAGLGAFEMRDAPTPKLPNVLKERTTWFIARGVKPAA